ncbi:arginase family protein [Amycolatopsis sp. CA-230715]|uniref:arginase family protein n=1 Tax=Amycolatopsis sp. CA-230715 TaxID=2745196 RepID=UPI001C034DE9|nr:arginase family protein [Amycolatopsis sp. CA-230715]QWF80314.1 Arginase [Amycolatopsis sp. CA-230715]
MTTILVPYHQDERLPDTDIPVPAPTTTVDPVLPDGDVWARMVALFGTVADAVAAPIRAGAVPAVVSGDCLAALGTLTGVQRAGLNPSLVWFDAHGDVHTQQSSTSGYLGGMVVRLALGAHRDQLADPLGLRPLAERQAALVDVRDLDPAEVEFLATSELRRHDIEALDTAELPEGPLVLHIDVDVIDNDELPNTRVPAANGPSRRAVLDAARRVVETGRVVAVDIACPWHPARDDTEARSRADLVAELISLAG